MALGLKKKKLQEHIYITGSEIICKTVTGSLKYSVKIMVFWITTYLLTQHRSPSATPVNENPSVCAMANECLIFSFELHSNMLSLHWNDVM